MEVKISSLNRAETQVFLKFSANININLPFDLHIKYDFIDDSLDPCLSDLHQSYSNLCQKTSPVTGHIIISSSRVKREVWPVIISLFIRSRIIESNNDV